MLTSGRRKQRKGQAYIRRLVAAKRASPMVHACVDIHIDIYLSTCPYIYIPTRPHNKGQAGRRSRRSNSRVSTVQNQGRTRFTPSYAPAGLQARDKPDARRALIRVRVQLLCSRISPLSLVTRGSSDGRVTIRDPSFLRELAVSAASNIPLCDARIGTLGKSFHPNFLLLPGFRVLAPYMSNTQ